MYPVSAEYKDKIQETTRVFKMQIEVQHSQGTLTLTDEHIVSGSFSYTESSQSGEDFMPGGVVASHVRFDILNKEDYAEIEWVGATVIPTVGLLLSSGNDAEYFLSPPSPAEFPKGEETETWEYVPLGVFHIDEVTKLRNTIEIKAIDGMIELDKPYSLSQLNYPATLYQIYVDICNVADIQPITVSFPNSGYVVQERPDDTLTLRDVLSAVGALAGRFARCTRTGQLEMAWYEPSGLELGPMNRFNFRPKDFTVQIKGVMATVDDVTYLAGTDDYAIDLTNNPLLQGDYETVIGNIYNAVKDTVFTPYESSWQGNPAIQAGDIITQIDRDGNEYTTLVTSSTYKYLGASTLSARGLPLKAKGYKGSTNKKLVEIKRRIDKEVGDKLTTLEQAQLNATELIANMLGGYAIPTEEAFYVADHEDLAQAVKVWKWGIGGFGYSENGVEGPYTTAITADGSIVANLVAAGIVSANMVKVTPQKTVADELNSKLTEGQNYAGVTIDANTGITITDSEGTSTVLDSNGMLDAYQINIADNLDATHPLTMRVYVPEGVSRVDTMELTAYADKFRAYQTGAHEAGAAVMVMNTGIQEIQFSSVNEQRSLFFQDIPPLNPKYGWAGTRVNLQIESGWPGSQIVLNSVTLGIQAGSGSGGGMRLVTWGKFVGSGDYIIVPSTGAITFQLQLGEPFPSNPIFGDGDQDINPTNGGMVIAFIDNGPSMSNAKLKVSFSSTIETTHTHDPVYAIYEDSMPTNVGIKIDGIDCTAALGGPWNGAGQPFALPKLELAPYIQTPGWHTIEFTSTTLGRITAALTCQQFIRYSGV